MVAYLVVGHRLYLGHVGLGVAAHGLNCPHSMWDLPRPGTEPMSPELQDRVLTTVPPRESLCGHFVFLFISATSSSPPL